MTITEKILAKHAGKKKVVPGEFIYARVDMALGNDITAPMAIEEFERLKLNDVFNRNKITLVPDHFTPNKDIKSAEQCKKLRVFARKYKIKNYFEVGQMGVEHALLPELGLVGPGEIVIGADSHTCTYGALGAFSTGVGSTDLAGVFATGKIWLKVPETAKFVYKGKLGPWVGGKDLILKTIGDIGVDGALYRAMEFSGEVISRLPMEHRLTMCNMAIEAGGKNGIIAPDKITKDYMYARSDRVKKKFSYYTSDRDAKYFEVREYDLSKLEPQVACPHLPSNVKSVSNLKNISIDQVVIGSCTNGRISDLREAAKILKNKRINSRVRLIVIPATQRVYLQAVKEGLVEIFVKSGAVVSTPTCGPCLGGHMGVLAEGERAVATTNRNFVGRMGHVKSEVYLSNPAVAAASAIKGKIAHPGDVV
ncbi:MAG: 3-isopropylmalate dehydratase large subunit [Candidatus Omnitrophota bacterium]